MPLLRIEPDNDIDAKHLLLDKRVNDSVEGEDFGEILKRGECVTLLCAIVTCSGGVLGSQYTDRLPAHALIAKHPELMDMLTAAWTSKFYRDIRNLAIFRHLLLDKRVNDSVKGEVDETDETLSRSECVSLLCAIVTCSGGVLDSQYTDRLPAHALIAKHPELMDKLTTAWRSKSYHEIRNLVILQARNTSDDGGRLTEKMKAELGLSLTKPYHGAAVDAFYEYLEQNQKDFSGGIKYYAISTGVIP